MDAVFDVSFLYRFCIVFVLLYRYCIITYITKAWRITQIIECQDMLIKLQQVNNYEVIERVPKNASLQITINL